MFSIAWRLTASLVAVACTIMPQSPAQAESRVALVIGNGVYRHVAALPNPSNDASDVAASLGRLGFSVSRIENAGFDDMRRALLDFGRKARGAEMAVVFFAGHGMEVGGENWLIPIDAELKSDIDAEQEAIGLKSVMLSVSGASKLGLVMLDACRSNPFAARMQRTVRVRAVDRGLSRVEPAGSVLVAYASRDGTTAKDGLGRNSPFTAALLRHIETPGLEITFLFRHVRDDVMTSTGREQEPYVYGSLSKEAIYLKSALSSPGTDAPPILQPPTMPSIPAPQAPKISAPREPLPVEVPIDAEVLRLVETHPFFANAPPVMVSSYAVSSTSSSTHSGGSSTNTSNDDTTVRWLREGIERSDVSQQMTSTSAGSTTRSTNRTTSVSAANGLISLGYNWVSTANVPSLGSITSTGTARLLRIDDLRGTVFPVQIGNRFSYRLTYRATSKNKFANTSDEHAEEHTCEISKKYEAKSFHPKLTGAAHLLACEVRTTYKTNKAANGNRPSKTFFFERLGSWITADPISPREQVVMNGEVQSGDSYTATITGTYTLKSFALTQ